jgi:transcriptional regulator with XRE-family HTH domain
MPIINKSIAIIISLKQIRTSKKVSQEELANETDFEISQISHIEGGIIPLLGMFQQLPKHLKFILRNYSNSNEFLF